MKRKMTLVFHDEDLYMKLKIEAVKRHSTASEIVADAVKEWLESREDAELLPVIEGARKEWKERGTSVTRSAKMLSMIMPLCNWCTGYSCGLCIKIASIR